MITDYRLEKNEDWMKKRRRETPDIQSFSVWNQMLIALVVSLRERELVMRREREIERSFVVSSEGGVVTWSLCPIGLFCYTN